MKMAAKTYKYIGLIILTIMMFACAVEKPMVKEQQNIVWPSAPAAAKIKFVRVFSNPEDLEISRGILQWFSDLFTGKEDFRMVRPMSVVVTENKKIYVADPGANGVHRFDMDDMEYELITRPDDKILASPVALSLGPDNSIFVADSELAQVFQIKDSADHALPVLTSINFKQPSGIAYHPRSKRVYVTDTGLHQIKIINENGKLYKTIGQRGSNDAEFNYPTYIWLDDKDRLLVTDSLNFRVQIFSTEGQFINKFGKHGDGSGNLSRPKGIAVDAGGNVYVIDALLHSIQIFSEQGDLLLPVGSQGHKAGEFWLPVGIFLSGSGEIYIADSHNQRVQVLRYVGGSS